VHPVAFNGRSIYIEEKYREQINKYDKLNVKNLTPNQLGDIIGQDSISVSYNVVNDDTISQVARFMPSTGTRIHPLLIDTWISAKADEEKIPVVTNTYVSPPIQSDDCKGSIMRYTLREKSGTELSLAEFKNLNGPISIEKGLAIGVSLIKNLQRMHASSIVHGNLEPENVLWTRYDDTETALSRILSPRTEINGGKIEDIRFSNFEYGSIGGYVNPMIAPIDIKFSSPWELENSSTMTAIVAAQVNEIFRVLQIVAWLVYPSIEYEWKIELYHNEIFEWKLQRRIFEIDTLDNPLINAGVVYRDDFKAALDALQAMVIRVVEVGEKIREQELEKAHKVWWWKRNRKVAPIDDYSDKVRFLYDMIISDMQNIFIIIQNAREKRFRLKPIPMAIRKP